MTKKSNVFFPEMRYFYLGTSEYRQGDPIIAFGYLLNMQDKTVKYSLTICSPKDTFVKEQSRKILQLRMRGEKFRTVFYTGDKPSSTIVIENIINDYNWHCGIENISTQKQYFKDLGFQRPRFLTGNLKQYLSE